MDQCIGRRCDDVSAETAGEGVVCTIAIAPMSRVRPANVQQRCTSSDYSNLTAAKAVS